MDARGAVLIGLLGTAPIALGQVSTYEKLADIKANGGQLLAIDDLRQLLPGAKVKSLTRTGSSRYWENSTDGKFIASSDGLGSTRRGGQAYGTWHVGDDGTYCVTLEWRRSAEQWCAYLFKVGDKYFGVRSPSDDAADAYVFEFTK